MVECRADELRQHLAVLSDPAGALSFLIEVAPGPVVLYSSAGLCVCANRAYREMFGEPDAGRDLSDDPALTRSGVLFWLRRAFSGENVTTPTFWYEPDRGLRADAAGRIAFSARAFPMRSAEGTTELVAIALRDETAALLLAEHRRHEAEEPGIIDEIRRVDLERDHSDEQFRAVFEKNPDGMMLTDDAGRILEINRAGCTILGRRVGEIVGSRWRDLFGEIRELGDGEDAAGDCGTILRLERADGEPRELELRIARSFLPRRHLTTFREVSGKWRRARGSGASWRSRKSAGSSEITARG